MVLRIARETDGCTRIMGELSKLGICKISSATVSNSLERFIVMGMRHMDYVVTEFVEFYNCKRPHRSLGLRTSAGPAQPFELRSLNTSGVRCEQQLGGLLRYHYRRAA